MDGLRAQLTNSVGKRLLHPGRDERRLALAWVASLYGARHDDPAGAALDASGDRRRLSRSAGGQLLVRADPAPTGAGPLADWLPVAMGSERVLGDQGGDQSYRGSACDRARVAENNYRGAG